MLTKSVDDVTELASPGVARVSVLRCAVCAVGFPECEVESGARRFCMSLLRFTLRKTADRDVDAPGCMRCSQWRQALFVGVCVLLLGTLIVPARADEVASAVYVRADTDKTTVISPRARVAKNLGEATSVDVAYAADIWSSASIDIRASASKRPVTEQRDELDLTLNQTLTDLTLHGGYRFSTEHDYTSHGASLGAAYDFAGNAARIDVALHAFGDTVGQAGNPTFKRGVSTLDASLSFTQVIDPQMLVQLTYELAHISGYQSSPYRWVGVGPLATGFGCVQAALCVHEQLPSDRTRHAFALLLRRAFSDAFSAGLTYRFYLDDWALQSHTVLAELGFNLSERTLLALRYRFYTQNPVRFYQKSYALEAPLRTRDRELAGMTYHRVGGELEHDFAVGEHGAKLGATLSVSGNSYSYPNFAGLSQVLALEVSAGLLLQP
jgi:hypothetical protein